MVRFERVEITGDYLRSLIWHEDHLVDILGGGKRYFLDRTLEKKKILRGYSYPFDSIVAHGDHAVLYKAHGTKAVLIEIATGEELRELNRPYYHADSYHYPITLFSLLDGRPVLAHCPKEYCTLDIELVETGECLTEREPKSDDIFHSILQASHDGRYLADNGWVWHPYNVLTLYDVEKALENPSHLDGWGTEMDETRGYGEPSTSTFCGHKLVHSLYLDFEPDDEEEEIEILRAEEGVPESPEKAEEERVREIHGSDLVIVDKDGKPIEPKARKKRSTGFDFLLQAYDIDNGEILSTRAMPEPPGEMMGVGEDHVVSFYDHPKLIEISTGKVVHRWEDLESPPLVHQPSAMMKDPTGPFLATDPEWKRFAIGTKDKIDVVLIHSV